MKRSNTSCSLLSFGTQKSCKSLQPTWTSYSGWSPISRWPGVSLNPSRTHLTLGTLESSCTGLSSCSSVAKKSGTSSQSDWSSVTGVTLRSVSSRTTLSTTGSSGSTSAFRTPLTLGTNWTLTSCRITPRKRYNIYFTCKNNEKLLRTMYIWITFHVTCRTTKPGVDIYAQKTLKDSKQLTWLIPVNQI